jgi:DNA mismatch repair protein MSH3
MGARDALAAGQSTFHVELSETNQILRSATPRSLVILDELGRGTSTADGVAIAHATSEYILTHVKACTLFVTHYPLLARLQDTYPHLVRNFHMAYVEEAPPQPSTLSAQVDPISGEPVVIAPVPSITFLFKLAPGPAPSSFGLNVARMAHVSETVLQRAALMAQRMRLRNQQQQRRRERDAQKQAWNLLKQVLQHDDVADEEIKVTVQRINDLRLALPAAT